MEHVRSAWDNDRSVLYSSVELIITRTIELPHRILYVTIGRIWHNHHNLAITFPRVQLVPDRVRLNMVSKQHCAVNKHLDTNSSNQTNVSLAAIDLELFQIFEQTKLRTYHDNFPEKQQKGFINVFITKKLFITKGNHFIPLLVSKYMEKGKQLQNDMLLLQKNENNEQVCTLHRFVHSIEVYSTVPKLANDL